MSETGKLFLYRRDYLRMAMSDTEHRDAACKVYISPPFDIPDFGIFRAIRESWCSSGNAARHRRKATSQKLFIGSHDFPRLDDPQDV